VQPIAKPDKPAAATLHCYHKHRHRHAAPDGRLLNCHKCDRPDPIIKELARRDLQGFNLVIWVNLKA
jgi:hypothetical protein